MIPSSFAVTWYVYVDEMPQSWKPHFGNIYDEATDFWEYYYPEITFVEVTQRENAHFVVQWSSQFQGDVLGYYTSSTNNDYGRPFVAITLGYMDDESVKWQDRKFNLVDPEYSRLITTHEIGHAIGFAHTNDTNDIMYPSIYDYDEWLRIKNSGNIQTPPSDSKTTDIDPYAEKALLSQRDANYLIFNAKTPFYVTKSTLENLEFESQTAKDELSKAWDSFYVVQDILAKAENAQKQAEGYITLSMFEEAYYMYRNSFEMVDDINSPLTDVRSKIELAKQLEDEYQQDKNQEVIQKQQTCFLFWCW